jgi:cytochrome P450
MLCQRTSLPPGPHAPPLWQLFRYSLTPLPFLEGCARRYGEAFTIRLAGYGRLVILSAPETVREVFRGDPHVLHSGEGNEFLSVSVGKTSVLVLDDEPHMRQRRILLPPLKGERMRSFFDAMQTATFDVVRAWPLGQPMSMIDPMRRITLRVILQAVLGLPPGPQLDEFVDRFRRMMDQGRMVNNRHSLLLMAMMPRWLFTHTRWLPFMRELRAIDDLLYPFIAARRREPAAARGDNIVANLLAATHENGSALSDVEIRDAVFTMLGAGFETTSLALAWALERIVPRQDVVQHITDELRQVTGGGPPQAEHLDRLVYLDAAIRESLRARTILPFIVRLTKKTFVAGGREYPPGVLLCPSNHLVHRRADLYPEPTVFRPERFLERRYGGHEWFPFGGGNRTCLGMAFALYEMKVVLGTLFAQVRLARPPGARSAPLRRGITLAPDDGARMVVMERL